MAEYIDKKDLEEYIELGYSARQILSLFDVGECPYADVVEREKIDKAIEEIKAESYREHIDGADCDDILIVELRDVLEILKRNIGENE